MREIVRFSVHRVTISPNRTHFEMTDEV